ncbi:hypothetical protein ACW9KT_19900 [Hymenobacter sp. HD11105]
MNQLRLAIKSPAPKLRIRNIDQTYHTGTISHGHQEVRLLDLPHGPVYFTFLAQALRDTAGVVTGLLLFAYDVSAHVGARYQVAAREW